MSRVRVMDAPAYLRAIAAELSEQSEHHAAVLKAVYAARGRLQAQRVALRALKARYPEHYAAVAAAHPHAEHLP
jgi:hypothetical protein